MLQSQGTVEYPSIFEAIKDLENIRFPNNVCRDQIVCWLKELAYYKYQGGEINNLKNSIKTALKEIEKFEETTRLGEIQARKRIAATQVYIPNNNSVPGCDEIPKYNKFGWQ